METHNHFTINPLKKGFKKSVTIYLLFFITMLIFLPGCERAEKELVLVKNGKSNAVIVIPPEINKLQASAIEDFTKTIFRSTGADIPVMNEEKAEMLQGKTIRIILGPSPVTDQLGYSS